MSADLLAQGGLRAFYAGRGTENRRPATRSRFYGTTHEMIGGTR